MASQIATRTRQVPQCSTAFFEDQKSKIAVAARQFGPTPHVKTRILKAKTSLSKN
jgi:hypothetical protein